MFRQGVIYTLARESGIDKPKARNMAAAFRKYHDRKITLTRAESDEVYTNAPKIASEMRKSETHSRLFMFGAAILTLGSAINLWTRVKDIADATTNQLLMAKEACDSVTQTLLTTINAASVAGLSIIVPALAAFAGIAMVNYYRKATRNLDDFMARIEVK
jgi:hypothetical protein